MTDITKCSDMECLKRMRCWRYRAPADKWQSWFSEPPRKGRSCAYFMPMKDSMKTESLAARRAAR
jgi:hypothetical protein